MNVNVTRPPTVTDCFAVSPLHKFDTPAGVQSAVIEIDASVSCRRVTVGDGVGGATSNASTITHAAVDAGFLSPTTSIRSV